MPSGTYTTGNLNFSFDTSASPLLSTSASSNAFFRPLSLNNFNAINSLLTDKKFGSLMGNSSNIVNFSAASSVISIFESNRPNIGAEVLYSQDLNSVNIYLSPNFHLRNQNFQSTTIFHELLHQSNLIETWENSLLSQIKSTALGQGYFSIVSSLVPNFMIAQGGPEIPANAADSVVKAALEHALIGELTKEFGAINNIAFNLTNYANTFSNVHYFIRDTLVTINQYNNIQGVTPVATQAQILSAFGLSLPAGISFSQYVNSTQVITDWLNAGGLNPIALNTASGLSFSDSSGQPTLVDVNGALNGGCFFAGTMIEMADGSQKPIEDIRPEDMVMSFDKDGRKVAGRVTRTMTNESKIILDFHGTFVTPGHVYYCAGGKFEGGFAPLIDILRDDGVVQHEDNTLIRAATGCKVGSELDAEIWVLGIEADANGVYHEKIRKKLRLGTRFIIPDGSSISIAEDLAKIGMRARADGFVEHIVTGQKALYQWPVGGQMPPNPEDYVLQRSGTTLEDIYRAGEWEVQRPQMPPPMIRDGGEITPVSERTLMAMPRNVPMAMREGTSPDASPKLNRKARKAMEAKRRKAAKQTRGSQTLH